jgi:hypothetical protein
MSRMLSVYELVLDERGSHVKERLDDVLELLDCLVGSAYGIHENQESATPRERILCHLNAFLPRDCLANEEAHVDRGVVGDFDRGDKSTCSGAFSPTAGLLGLGLLRATAFLEFRDLLVARKQMDLNALISNLLAANDILEEDRKQQLLVSAPQAQILAARKQLQVLGQGVLLTLNLEDVGGLHLKLLI